MRWKIQAKPLPSNIPAKAVIPLYLGKAAENFLLSDKRVLLSNFGEEFSPSADVRLGEDCHTPLAMRPPEAQFEPRVSLSYPADIWSLAVAIWEILGMNAVFSSEFTSIDEIVSRQIDVLGPMPLNWWERWEERSQFVDSAGRPKEGRDVWSPIEEAFDEGMQKYRRNRGVGGFDKEEAAAILDLMRRMLALTPEERPTVDDVLNSEWMVKWVMPGFERSLKVS